MALICAIFQPPTPRTDIARQNQADGGRGGVLYRSRIAGRYLDTAGNYIGEDAVRLLCDGCRGGSCHTLCVGDREGYALHMLQEHILARYGIKGEDGKSVFGFTIHHLALNTQSLTESRESSYIAARRCWTQKKAFRRKDGLIHLLNLYQSSILIGQTTWGTMRLCIG